MRVDPRLTALLEGTEGAREDAAESVRAFSERMDRERSTLRATPDPRISSPMSDIPLIDAKIAASEARTDTKFAKLEGKLDLIVASLETVKGQAVDAKAEARTTRRYVVGTGFSLGALLLGMFGLYANAFNIGTRVDDIARTEAQQAYNEMAVQAANERALGSQQEPARSLPAPPENASAN